MILKQSSDGFEIAEKDLFLRGSGDFFGTNQSGLPKWRFFTPYKDLDFLEKTKIDSSKRYEILLKSNRNLRKDYHVEDFEQGEPDYFLITDSEVEETWGNLKNLLDL